MTYDTMTRDDLIATLRSRQDEIERLSLDLHDARNQLQAAWAQLEAIGAGGVSGKRITDDGALGALQACEQAYHQMIANGTPQDCRAHDAARVAFWRVFGGNAQSTDARWYAVAADGVATLCADREDARDTAAEAAQCYPNEAPYIAVQLAPVGRGETFGRPR